MIGPKSDLRERLLPHAWLVLLLGFVYFPLLLGQVLYQRDISRQIYPAHAFLHNAWTTGVSSLWNPLQGLGQPTLANPLNQLFYPIGAPFLLGISPRWDSVFLILHLVLGGLGMVSLTRALARVPVVAALVAGLAWCLSGYATSETTAGLRWASGAYMPWCALGLLQLSRASREGGGVRAWLWAAAWAALPFALCFMTGEVFFPFLAALFSVGVVVGDRVQNAGGEEAIGVNPGLVGEAATPSPRSAGEKVGMRGPARHDPSPQPSPRNAGRGGGMLGLLLTGRLAPGESAPHSARVWALRVTLGAVLVAMVAGLLAAVVLVPAGGAARATQRREPLTLAAAEVGSLHPLRLAEMIAPGAMGDPYADYPAGPWVGEASLGERPLLYGCYLGSSVLALALLAFGRKRKLAAALAITAVSALLVSLGRHTWAHATIRLLVPPLAFMRGPEKYLSVFFACTSLLAGLGCARLLNERGRTWPRMLAVAVALVALVGASRLFPAPIVAYVRAGALGGLVFALAIAATGWLAGRWPRWAGSLLVAVVLMDLARAVFALQNFAAPAEVGGEPAGVAAILADARARGELAPPRVHRVPSVDPAIAAAAPPTSVLQVQRNLVRTLIDNHPGAFGIGSVPGYDAALSSTLASLWTLGQHEGVALFRLLGVNYLVLPNTSQELPGLVPLADLVPGVRLYRVANPLPRVYLAQPTSNAPDQVAGPVLFSPEVLAGQRAVPAVSPTPPDAVKNAQATLDDVGTCQLVAFANTRIEATCEARAFALAVFLEQYYPGWSATVDEQPAPLLRANLVMRAVPISAGHHHIVLTFSPPGLWTGIALSLAGLVALVVLLVLARRRSAQTQT